MPADTGKNCRQRVGKGVIFYADKYHVLYACCRRVVRYGGKGRMLSEYVAVEDEALFQQRFFARSPGDQRDVGVGGA